MRRVILVRHGESALNAANKHQKILCGQFETPLTERGREQARDVGKLLAGRADLRITDVISSRLGRARETLELLLSRFPDQPTFHEPHSDFNERSLGLFEGRLEDDVFREFPRYRDDPQYCRFRDDYEQKAPQGENLTDVSLRAWNAFEQFLLRTRGDVLIVSHYNTIRCLVAQALHLSRAESLRLHIRHAAPIVLRVDDTYRLEGDLPFRSPQTVP